MIQQPSSVLKMEDVMESEVDKAKDFWSSVDVNFVFDALCGRLQYLRERIEADSATDREFIVGMNIILASELYMSPKSETNLDEEALLYAGDPGWSSDLRWGLGTCRFKPDILPVSVTDGDTVDWNVDSELFQDNSRPHPGAPPSLLVHRESPPFSPDPRLSPPQPGADRLSVPSPLRFESGEALSPLPPPRPEPQDLPPPSSPEHPPGPAQTGGGSPMAPMSLLQPPFQPHSCSRLCLPRPPPTDQRSRGRNPLKLPLLWGFQRQQAAPKPGGGAATVFYKAPCGRSLRGREEAWLYLRETEADAQLRAGQFCFSAAVQLQRRVQPPGGAGELLEADLSRGAEPVAVQLVNGLDGERPERFRYRAQRWPRACLPSSGPVYTACCDCADGCADEAVCACLQLTRRANRPDAPLYRHQCLPAPLPSGLYECGPWCGCDRARCQNRVVQLGLQVRLQVFRTPDRGWGVRCVDDLDQGAFVCTYTGVVLRAGPEAGLACSGAVTSEPAPHKRKREEQSSDDEVELVEEWRVPAMGLATPPNPDPPNPPASSSPPVHVSVIQTPAGPPVAPGNSEQPSPEPQSGGVERGTSPSSGSHSLLQLSQTDTEAENGRWEGKEAELGLRSEWAWLGEGGAGDEDPGGADEEHLYYLDATEEGNVGRFLNHSCCPNLFVQNVFTDSHHRDFPTIAFFTCRTVTAGTELTWNYSYDPGSVPEQEVPCQCGCESCKGVLI